jgi:ribosomal protein L34E
MVTKKTTAKKPPATPAKKTTPVAAKPEKMQPHQLALSSNTMNAVSIMSWGKFAGVTEDDLQELVNDLGEQTKNVQAGDMRSVEGMLYRQAKTLETMFTCLARRSASETGLKQFQVNLTLALKAQAQCRATLEALAEIKNPRPVQFVKQANMTTGPQQVNNGYAGTSSHSCIQSGAGNIQSEQNKLLEADHGNYLDTRAPSAASRVNQTVEAVG